MIDSAQDLRRATSGFSIFVVEDEVLIRMALGASLRDLGFTVYELHDADEALAVIEAGKEPNALVTDIMMPGSIDGVKLAIYLQTMFPALNVFVTSGQITES